MAEIADQYSNQHSILSAPVRVSTVTPSDSADLTHYCYCVWLSAAGDIKIDGIVEGTAVVIPGVPANQWVPLAAKRIYNTDTTATIAVIGY